MFEICSGMYVNNVLAKLLSAFETLVIYSYNIVFLQDFFSQNKEETWVILLKINKSTEKCQYSRIMEVLRMRVSALDVND